jgi:hypothetical protein
LLCGYLLFRRAYFAAWLPNTYYAKDRAELAFLLRGDKWLELCQGALGPFGALALLALAASILALLGRRRTDARSRALAVHLTLAAFSFMVMPEDWMGEFRFATAFLLFFYWALAETARSWLEALPTPRRILLAVGLVGVLATNTFLQWQRLRTFSSAPIVPLEEVASRFGRGFNRLAEALPTAPSASILLPDVGGTLLESRLRVFDLAGLCDATIAATLAHDTRALHGYVFDRLRPTFIHVHGGWAGLAGFSENPRLAEDYAVIHERRESDSAEPDWGDYVRRDALGRDAVATLRHLRSLYAAVGGDPGARLAASPAVDSDSGD